MATSNTTSVAHVMRAFGKAKADTGRTIADGLARAAQTVLAKALVLCPKDTGALRKTGTVVVTGRGFGAKAKVEFGGPEAPYALYVHENPDAYHEPPTTHRFLTKAVIATNGTNHARLRRMLKGELSKYVNGEEA